MNNLNDISLIKKVDKDDMLRFLIEFPFQCLEAEGIGSDFKISKRYFNKKYNNVVFAGMGGSAMGADLIKYYLKFEIKIPIYVNRDYTLPEFVNKSTLLFVCSYSGNTEETLSAFEIARRKKANTILLSAGGRLEKLSLDYKIPFIKIPQGFLPRCALGHSFFPLLVALNRLGLIKSKRRDIKQVYELLTKKRDVFEPSIETKNNTAKKIAYSLHNKYIVIYGSSSSTEAVATRLRSQLAENSKALSCSHVFPEMNHNEIEGWLHPHHELRDFLVVFLKDKGDHIRVKRRMDITEKIIKKSKAKVIEIHSEGENLLTRLFSLVYICDWISFYLAILNDVNPAPVDRIAYLKKELIKE